MNTPIKELINLFSDSREKLIEEKLDAQGEDLWFLDGMIHQCTGVILLLKQTYLDKEKEIIINAYFEGEKEWAYEYRGYMNNFDREEAERYYNKTFNNELDEQKN